MNPVKSTFKYMLGMYEKRCDHNMFKAKNLSAHEWLALREQPALTDAEIKEIDDYWKQYGIKFRDYSWFQWYYGINGQKDPRYIPNDVYAYIVWPYYNNELYSHAAEDTNHFVLAWRDKNYFEKYLPDVPFPRTVVRRIHKRFYDQKWNPLGDSLDAICDILLPVQNVIVKDALDTGEGRGVKKYSLRTKDDVQKLLDDWKSSNYLIQEVIRQHPFFAQFNESSVNMMRINSWRHGNKIEILSPVLRYGIPGFVTDVAFVNGTEIVKAVGISLDGYLNETAIALDGSKTPTRDLIRNPGERVPFWDEIIEIIKTNAPKLQHFDIVGWDFTVSADERPICIEYNIQRPSTVLCQPNNGPFFAEHTDEMLAFLKEENNREKYIPNWLRL